MSEIAVVGVAKKELALRVAAALAENTELTETVENLRSDLVAQREDAEAAKAALEAEVARLQEECRATLSVASALRERLDTLRAALAADGKVLDIKCRTMSELYVRETIQQRLAGILKATA